MSSNNSVSYADSVSGRVANGMSLTEPSRNASDKGKGKAVDSDPAYDQEFPPLVPGVWPPEGFELRDFFTPEQAEHYVATGAAILEEQADMTIHEESEHGVFRASASGAITEIPHVLHSSHILGASDVIPPTWPTLEQPSMLTIEGVSSGTTTFAHWISSGEKIHHDTPKPSTLLKVREWPAAVWARRIRKLQMNFESDEDSRRFKLYDCILDTPEGYKTLSEQREIRGQIYDIASALGDSTMIDFAQLENKIVARFFRDANSPHAVIFYSQLTLGIELLYRLREVASIEGNNPAIYEEISRPVAWTLALAERWLNNIEIEFSDGHEVPNLHPRDHRRNSIRLYDFALSVDWLNLEEISNFVDSLPDNGDPSLPDLFVDASMTWAFGLTLPGPTSSWLPMISIGSLAPGAWPNLKVLEKMDPDTGFQAPWGSYWYSDCIVGKVLGALRGVKQSCGWIFCQQKYDQPDFELGIPVKIFAKDLMGLHQVHDIARATCPIGPHQDCYPVNNFWIPKLITTQHLKVENIESVVVLEVSLWSERRLACTRKVKLPVKLSEIFFLVKGSAVCVPLRHNVSFIACPPCLNGPHPLHRDQKIRSVFVWDLTEVASWPDPTDHFPTATEMFRFNPSATTLAPNLPPRHQDREDPIGGTKYRRFSSSSGRSRDAEGTAVQPDSSRRRTSSPPPSKPPMLIIEALADHDQEVLARAWCAEKGLCAVVCNLKAGNCIACACRVAVGALISVVIVVKKDYEAEAKKLAEKNKKARAKGDAPSQDKSWVQEKPEGCGGHPVAAEEPATDSDGDGVAGPSGVRISDTAGFLVGSEQLRRSEMMEFNRGASEENMAEDDYETADQYFDDLGNESSDGSISVVGDVDEEEGGHPEFDYSEISW